jgi:ectoine hydroxylase-related dioxygenase (phytanoyl-CoA dioxygenase family)
LAWDLFPFPNDYEVECAVLWAMSEYTAEMGATRVVPGSHKGNKKSFADEDTVAAEMPRGSALFYTGKVCHGAGANQSDKIRQAIGINYIVGWLRQEENQYLVTPLELAKTLPDDLLKVMGYQMGCVTLGYVRDYEDPLKVLRHPDQRVAVDAKRYS